MSMPVALAGFKSPAWCVGYGPAPEPAAAKLDPAFHRPSVVPFPFNRVDDFVQMATQNWEI